MILGVLHIVLGLLAIGFNIGDITTLSYLGAGYSGIWGGVLVSICSIFLYPASKVMLFFWYLYLSNGKVNLRGFMALPLVSYKLGL